MGIGDNMAFDGIVLSAITKDLEKIEGMRVEKIYQPSQDELFINFRGPGQKLGLYISVGSSSPKLYITDIKPTNPPTPPAFCMLLRKHLEGGRVLGVFQTKLDRILRIEVESRNELRDNVKKSLYIEIMGKHSNIILVDNPGDRIIDSIKRVNSSMSSKRVVLPGEIYSNENISTEIDPRGVSEEEFFSEYENYSQGGSVKNFLIKSFTGVSPLIVREIVYSINIDETRPLNSLNDEEKKSLYREFKNLFESVEEGNYSPVVIAEGEKYIDFSAVDLKMYPKEEKIHYENISDLLFDYYSKRENDSKLDSKSRELKKIINGKLSKLLEKKRKQYSELNEALDREKYRVYADLLSANLHNILENTDRVVVNNFYTEDNEEIEIPMDIRHSPLQNAQRYYKKYSKLKNAAIILEEQIEENDNLIEYLKSILYDIEVSQNPEEIDEIKEELRKHNILSRGKSTKTKKVEESNYMEFENSDGFVFLVGKNNRQNEKLSLKDGKKNDLWFHVKSAPGSHVVLKNNGRDFSNESLLQGAALAAKYSPLSNSNNIEVDYTWIKNVTRHPSNFPGLVNYVNYKTIVVKKEDLDLIGLTKSR